MRVCAVALPLLLAATVTQAAGRGPLFPTPFSVEHQVVITDPDGSVFAAPPVVDHYGGSWIVSVRPDGGRTVVDLARREVMDVDPTRGTYSVLTFDRWAELVRRIQRAERGGAAEEKSDDSESDGPAVAYAVTAAQGGGMDRHAKSAPVAQAPFSASGVRHLLVTPRSAEAPPAALEVWVDPGLQLSAPALDALEALDRALLGQSTEEARVTYPAMVAAARREADGAFVVRSLRPLRLGGDPAEVGLSEDRALAVDTATSFPLELVEVPEGFRRVPHVLETTASWAESDAELRRRMTDVSE